MIFLHTVKAAIAVTLI